MESFESTLVSCPVDDLSNLSSPVDNSMQGEISIGDGRIEASGTEGTIGCFAMFRGSVPPHRIPFFLIRPRSLALRRDWADLNRSLANAACGAAFLG